MENMEATNETSTKQQVGFNYQNSGVKLCNKLSLMFKILSVVSGIVTFILLIMLCGADSYDIMNYFTWFFIGLVSTINCIISFAFFTTLSSIAKTALFKRAVMEQKYEFIEYEDVDESEYEE